MVGNSSWGYKEVGAWSKYIKKVFILKGFEVDLCGMKEEEEERIPK